jgi:peptide subunit release factor 1 (eRF1)
LLPNAYTESDGLPFRELQQYAREIVQDLQSIGKKEQIDHILLFGGKEILREIYDNLEVEKECEGNHWERIRREYLRSGLGIVGIENVLAAALQGKVDRMVVCREFNHTGYRCRECDTLFTKPFEVCAICNSTSLYEVDAVNELDEIVVQQGGEIGFVDPIDTLVESGSVGALLRYK